MCMYTYTHVHIVYPEKYIMYNTFLSCIYLDPLGFCRALKGVYVEPSFLDRAVAVVHLHIRSGAMRLILFGGLNIRKARHEHESHCA